MDVSIKKVSESNGVEQFALVDPATREPLTVREVDEAALRRFFSDLGVRAAHINSCLSRARDLFDEKSPGPAAESAGGEDELLLELGLDEDD